MQISTMFFIVGILVVGCFGGIAVLASSNQSTPTGHTDTFGSAVSQQTNDTEQTIIETGNFENQGMSVGILIAVGATIAVIIIGIMLAIKSQTKRFVGSKYRT